MRSLAVVLALCLGLFAVAQAEYEGVLLQGAQVDSDQISLEYSHRHHRHHHHDPSDHHYWAPRHSYKDEMLGCIHHAVSAFVKDDPLTWKPAGEALAKCLLKYLGKCHDVPGLPDDITRTVPYVMYIAGLDALVAEGPDGLLHAELVLSFYLAGGYKTIDGVSNPWYSGPDSCASKLVSYLNTACLHAGAKQLHALALTFVKHLEHGLDSEELKKCLPDIPAVILSVVSSYCPQSGQLINPLNGTIATCNPAGSAYYEDSAGALLGGSIITALLLSGNAKLAALGTQVSFAMNRMAFAATQTTAAGCFDPTDVTAGQLFQALQAIPKNSGPLGSVVNGSQAYTPLPLGIDGQRVLCFTIAMMSFPGFPPVITPRREVGELPPWYNSVLLQGTIDVSNAIHKTIALGLPFGGDGGETSRAVLPGVTGAIDITHRQIGNLCAVGKSIFSFTTSRPLPINAGDLAVQVTLDASPSFKSWEVSAEYPTSYSCMTSYAQACPFDLLPWEFQYEPAVAEGHDLSDTSYTHCVCSQVNWGAITLPQRQMTKTELAAAFQPCVAKKLAEPKAKTRVPLISKRIAPAVPTPAAAPAPVPNTGRRAGGRRGL